METLKVQGKSLTKPSKVRFKDRRKTEFGQNESKKKKI